MKFIAALVFVAACLIVGEIIAAAVASAQQGNSYQVPRLQYAIELRDALRAIDRLCYHPEDWDKTTRAIAAGAPLIEIAVCHHDKKSRRTMYRVTARWLQVKDYPSASVVEGVER